MGWECIIKGHELEDLKKDRKNTQRIERYELSEKAVYLNGLYLPISLIESIRVQPSVYRPNHCCGIGIPIYKIRVDYGSEKPVVLMIESEKNTEKMVTMLCSNNTDITVEYYVDPHTGLKPERISPPLY